MSPSPIRPSPHLSPLSLLRREQQRSASAAGSPHRSTLLTGSGRSQGSGNGRPSSSGGRPRRSSLLGSGGGGHAVRRTSLAGAVTKSRGASWSGAAPPSSKASPVAPPPPPVQSTLAPAPVESARGGRRSSDRQPPPESVSVAPPPSPRFAGSRAAASGLQLLQAALAAEAAEALAALANGQGAPQRSGDQGIVRIAVDRGDQDEPSSPTVSAGYASYVVAPGSITKVVPPRSRPASTAEGGTVLGALEAAGSVQPIAPPSMLPAGGGQEEEEEDVQYSDRWEDYESPCSSPAVASADEASLQGVSWSPTNPAYDHQSGAGSLTTAEGRRSELFGEGAAGGEPISEQDAEIAPSPEWLLMRGVGGWGVLSPAAASRLTGLALRLKSGAASSHDEDGLAGSGLDALVLAQSSVAARGGTRVHLDSVAGARGIADSSADGVDDAQGFVNPMFEASVWQGRQEASLGGHHHRCRDTEEGDRSTVVRKSTAVVSVDTVRGGTLFSAAGHRSAKAAASGGGARGGHASPLHARSKSNGGWRSPGFGSDALAAHQRERGSVPLMDALQQILKEPVPDLPH